MILTVAMLMASCGSSRLYYWGSNPNFDKGTSDYEKASYKYYDKQSPESLCDLLCVYEDMVSNPGGTRGVVPPGICAEYGYLLLQPQTATVFYENASNRQKRKMESSEYGSDFRTKGIAMLEMEIQLYPESAVFVAPLLKKLKENGGK